MSDAPADHNRILTVAAREGLGSLGLIQKGRSRVWLDDHGWWVVVVEFQPSSWSKGSYLNVGFQHLWRVTDHVSLSRPGRLSVDGEQFVTFDAARPEAFRSAANRLVDRAREEVEHRRSLHGNGLNALERIARSESESIYELYDAGTALGLLGEHQGARERFARILTSDGSSFGWLAALRQQTQVLVSMLDDGDAIDAEVQSRVFQTRSALRLTPWSGDILA